MVPVSGLTTLLLSDVRSTLLRSLTRRPQTDSAILFAHWMLRRAVDEGEAKVIASAAAQRTGAQLDFQTVAAIGFARESALLGDDVRDTLRQGIERLAGRNAFVDGNPMPFCSDAAGVLGVALGTRTLEDKRLSAKISAWLSGFLPSIFQLEGIEDAQRHLFRAADYVLGGSINLDPTWHGQAPDVLVALVGKRVLQQGNGVQTEQAEELGLKLVISEAGMDLPFERAAMRLAALEQVIRSAPTVVPGRIGAPDLVRLLERIPAGLRKWTWENKPRTANAPLRAWHIDNEYHVQNLLWALLAPIFPDLDDEQYLAKIGQKSPRADLHIPSMKIIIEAKFLRAGEAVQRVIDEISSDTGLYGSMGNDCAGIIPVIWDDSARSHEHDYLRQGLKKLPNIVDAIIISRPGWIGDESQSRTKKRENQAKKKS